MALRWPDLPLDVKPKHESCGSESVLNMDPLKHLHMGQWPCLKGIICHGQDDIALPVCWLWGDSASNLLLATTTQCSLDANIIQSLVTICPHLCSLSLVD